MDGIRYWIDTEGAGHWFFIVFPVVLVWLLIWFKGRRVRFLIPSLIISLVIINPWFYKKWNDLGLYAYWRILWVVPVISIVAGLIPSITERINKEWIKALVVAGGIGLVLFGGTFLYNGTGGSFVEAANAAKLPDYVVQIADRLLDLKETPRIIAEPSISVYIRQYTGYIKTLFGRDIHGYIIDPSSIAENVSYSLTTGKLDYVKGVMLDSDYDYLVLSENPGEQFELVESIGNYGIYKPIGEPSYAIERNALGQIISTTSIDNDGNPVNNSAGYSTIHYDYDEYNNTIYEFRTDETGSGVADIYGCAGFKRVYDYDGHIIQEIKLGKDGNPCEGVLGFAEVKRTFIDGNLISESYYDKNGRLTNQTAGFAMFNTEYDQLGRRISRFYYDNTENLVERQEGYMCANWSVDDHGIWRINFVKKNGEFENVEGLNLVADVQLNPDGWSDWIVPKMNKNNSTFYIGELTLGERNEGDAYTCQIEIEFRDVSATDGQSFRFCTQGPQDNKWFTNNVWNPDLIDLQEVPEDGIYTFSSTVFLWGNMVEVSNFAIGFRCDYWSSGSYRIRNIKIEKSDVAGEWSFGV